MGAGKKEPRIIAASDAAGHPARWREALRDAVTDAGVAALRRRLPGCLVPRPLRESAGAESKTPVA